MTSSSSAARSPRIFAIANQKGGVGKTTTTINIGTAMGAVGKKVLLIDMDPQGNASTGLGLLPTERSPSIYDVLIGDARVDEAIRETSVPNVFLIPAVRDLAGASTELLSTDRRSYRLRDSIRALIKSLQESGGGQGVPIDYVLIDCPPSLDVLTVNALAASHGVVVPLQCEFFALEGLSELLRTINRVKSTLNPDLEIEGIVLTMFDKRNNLSSQVADDVREHLGDKVYSTIIPRNVRVSEAPSHGIPAILYDHKCSGSKAYVQLAAEVMQHNRDESRVSA